MRHPSATPRLTVDVNERDHVLGPATAPVTLVEYGDYECPFCGQAHHVVHALLKRLGSELRFAFRHFPIVTAHPHAQQAAEAAEAAGAQDQFWEMYYTLFEHQDALEDSDLIEYASALGLDVDQFTRELAEHVHADKVRADFVSGVRSGVNGTPTFFINGYRHNGAFDFDTLLQAITGAMQTVGGRR